jgi:hypothetical protein
MEIRILQGKRKELARISTTPFSMLPVAETNLDNALEEVKRRPPRSRLKRNQCIEIPVVPAEPITRHPDSRRTYQRCQNLSGVSSDH